MATINERILDAQVKHSVYLERYKAGVLKKIIGLLNGTEGDLIVEIAGRLANIEQRGYDLGLDATKRLNALLKAIRDRRTKVYDVLQVKLSDEMDAFAVYEADYQIRLADNAGVGIDLVAPSNAQLKAIVTSQPFQGRLLKEWSKGLAFGDIQRINDAVRIGITSGQTTDQIVRRIRGTKAAQYQDGIIEIARRDAEAVVRTAVGHVQNRARMEVFSANADIIPGVQYAATLDSKTTIICASRDGTVYALDKAPPIPAHFRCRSIYVPYFGPRDGNRASKFGPVPASTTYEAFLRKQSADFQTEVLGVERARLFRSGRVSLTKFVEKSGRSYTLKELARREKS